MIVQMTADEIKALLKLEELPVEGGWFQRTYTSSHILADEFGIRPASTAIYYLLEAGSFSEMHQLITEEMYHFYLGSPVEMLKLYPDGRSETVILGPDLAAGQQVQLLVESGVWQGSRLVDDRLGSFALLGCTLVPGFEYEDYRNASAEELIEKWPDEAERIKKLTRS